MAHNHIEKEGPPFYCECGNGTAYESLTNLKQHKRRYCKKSVDTSCPVCSTMFETYAGMRQHMKRSHPTEYNDDLIRETENKTRMLWTHQDRVDMATEELKFSGKFINQFLSGKIGLPVETIKNQRKTKEYKSVLATIRDRERVPEVQPIVLEKAPSEDLLLEPELEQHPTIENTAINDNITAAPNEGSVMDVEIDLPLVLEEPLNDSRRDDLLRQTSVIEPSNTAIDPMLLHLRSLMNRVEDEEDLNLITRLTDCKTKTDLLDTWLEKLIRQHNPKFGKATIAKKHSLNLRRNQNSHQNCKIKRAQEYKRLQQLFKKDTKRLASELFDGQAAVNASETPPNDEIEERYVELLQSESLPDDSPVTDIKTDPFSLYMPITENEIKAAIKFNKSDAAGPDGIKMKQLTKIPVIKLEILFNLCLFLGYIPKVLKISRTTLIPKTNTQLHKVDNWRPITVSSLILRINNRIIAARLSRITIHQNQRGFTKEDGCFINNLILQTLIKEKRSKGHSYTIITLDLKRAFDTISHNSIERMLNRFNFDEASKRYILAHYAGCQTTISISGKEVCSVSVKRGVKQGDPFSPVLFNLVMDELVCSLNSLQGATIGPHNISCLAYADDLVLLANDTNQAKRLLKSALGFFNDRNLLLNVAKCTALSTAVVPSRKKTYVITRPTFRIYNGFIPQISVDDTFKYLGSKFNYMGTVPCSLSAARQQLQKLKSAPLKPNQKLKLLKQFLMPRYIHSAQSPSITKRALRELDRQFGLAAKHILHLPKTVVSSTLYARLKDGGLGLFNFSQKIPLIMRSRWSRLFGGSELLDTVLNASHGWFDRIDKMIPSGLSSTEFSNSWKSSLENSWYGGGLHEVSNHRHCSSYIDNAPSYWKGRDYVKSIQLRLSCLPVKGIPSNPPSERRCRFGCFKQETISHVLQSCPTTHWCRIKRHNFIAAGLKRAAIKAGWQVIEECHVRDANGLLRKPDLIFIKDQKLIVSDVGVAWESPFPLLRSYDNKVAIYSTPDFIQAIYKKFNPTEVRVLPLTVGARGTWCRHNDFLVKALNLPASFVQDTITLCLKGGIICHKEFMQAVTRVQNNNR